MHAHRSRGGGPGLVLDLDVGEGLRHAGEDAAGLAFGVGERARLVGAERHLAVQHRALALAAAAAPAIEGHGQVVSQAGVEDRLVLLDRQDPVVGLGQHVEGADRPAPELRGQPRGERGEDRERAHERPERAGRPAVDERVGRQVEPVELQRRGGHGEVGRGLAQGGLHEGKRDHRRAECDHEGPRRQGLRVRNAMGVDPEDRQHGERQADVHERKEREEAVVHVLGAQEVAHQQPVEDRERVEPLRGRGHGELRELVPRQHVAVDAGGVDEPEQENAAHPGEPAEAAVLVEGEVAHEVQCHREDHAVGGVAVQAANDAPDPFLVVGHALDRKVGLGDAGIEEGVEVEARRHDDPEKPVAQRAEVVERVQPVRRRSHWRRAPPRGTGAGAAVAGRRAWRTQPAARSRRRCRCHSRSRKMIVAMRIEAPTTISITME